MSSRWVALVVVVLFVAYVAGRAAGILLDANPYVTEVVAMVVALGVLGASARWRSA